MTPALPPNLKLSRSRWRTAWGRFCRDRMAVLGGLILLLILLGVLLGPMVYPISYSEIDVAQATAPPSWTHPLGTNPLGQDQLARMLWGGRVSVAVGITAMLVLFRLASWWARFPASTAVPLTRG